MQILPSLPAVLLGDDKIQPMSPKTNNNQPPSKFPDSAKQVYSGILYNVYHWDQKLYDNSITTFEGLERNDSVSVIPITADNQIVVTYQQQPHTTPFIGMPGGIIEPGEDSITAGYRELLEETGYEVSELEQLTEISFGSSLAGTSYYYIGRDAKVVGPAEPDPGEKIEVELVDFDKFLELLYDPSFRDTDLAIFLIRKIYQDGDHQPLKNLLFG